MEQKRMVVCYMLVMLILCVILFEYGKRTTEKEVAEENIFTGNTIKIGLLFSTTGTSSVLEKSMLNAAILAIDEINKTGGIEGKQIEYVQEDYASDPATAAKKIKKLVTKDKVIATVGCYTSASRKATLSTLEKENAILIYPTYTEGEEEHPNVIYTGAMPNQQATDYVPWLLENCGKKAFLVGNDYVFSVTCNKQAKILIEQGGGTVLGEEYVALGSIDFDGILEKIKKEKPDFIYCDLVGDSTIAFYREYMNAGFNPSECPIASITTDEMTLQSVGAEYMEGHYTSMNYFSTLKTKESKQFVENYKKKYQGDAAITGLAETSYVSCYLLKEAIEKTGKDFGTKDYTKRLLDSFTGVSYHAPGGFVKIASNHCMSMTSRFAVCRNGVFQVIYESKKPIEPEPWFSQQYFE